MNSIDFTPLYRSSVGFDRLASLLDSALRNDHTSSTYPPYNIEVIDDNRYTISLAVAGFSREDLDIKMEQGILTIKGKNAEDKTERKYLYQGIASRSFERRFNLADHVEVTGAELNNGLLTINLVREIPEAMKPKTIAINASENVLEHKTSKEKVA
ncbi:Hsp20 family protein [Zooshikella harenae]|uniref:Hsp20 family protein n=1 Tax=Zooshikella harenae TaxID=2827238 RepID=A0ABS5ZA90_9GAMM|nr:Hsp20 family protein [Zooshikella harenae]MBU2710803.1 Hsp20 family protein [Zooshikella harenae]